MAEDEVAVRLARARSQTASILQDLERALTETRALQECSQAQRLARVADRLSGPRSATLLPAARRVIADHESWLDVVTRLRDED